MDDLLPADWEQQIVRAYTVFDIEPSLGEFGFGFPRLSTSFLRSKAIQQLRDKFGRWRQERGSLFEEERSPVARIGRPVPSAAPASPSAPGFDPFGEPADLPKRRISKAAERIYLHLQDLPAQPAELTEKTERLEDHPDLVPVRRTLDRAVAERDLGQRVRGKLQEAAEKDGPQSFAVTDVLDDEEMEWLKGNTRLTDDRRLYYDSFMDIQDSLDQYEAEVGHWERTLKERTVLLGMRFDPDGTRKVPAVDAQDHGPDQQLVDALATMEAMGREVDDIVESVLAQEGWIADLYRHSEFSMERIGLQNRADELILKANQDLADQYREIAGLPPGLELHDKWLLASAMAHDPGNPSGSTDFEEVLKYLDRRAGDMPDLLDIQVELSIMDLEQAALDTGRFAQRRSQVARQVLRELGVEFGPPADMEPPYRRLRPLGGEAVEKEMRISDQPPKPPQPGDQVWFYQYTPSRAGTAAEHQWVGGRYARTEADGSIVVHDDEGAILMEVPKVSQDRLYYEGELYAVTEAEIATALSGMPTDYIRQIWRDQPMIGVVHDQERAARSHRMLHMRPRESVSTILHEEHHGLEQALPWVRAMEWTSIADSAYDGEPGARTRKPAPTGGPRYERTPLLDIHGPGSRYEGYENSIEDDHVLPYAGKIYIGNWGERTVGGPEAMSSSYELLTVTSEDVLSGTPRGVGVPSAIEIGHSRLEADRQDRSRQSREWYLGQLLYAAAAEHGGEEMLADAMDLDPAADGASRMNLESGLGRRVPRTAPVPAKELSRLRDLASQGRGRTEIWRDGDVWTMRFTPIGASEEQSLIVSYKVPPSGGRAKMVRGMTYGDAGRGQVRATQVEQVLKTMLESQRLARRSGVTKRFIRETLPSPEGS